MSSACGGPSSASSPQPKDRKTAAHATARDLFGTRTVSPAWQGLLPCCLVSCRSLWIPPRAQSRARCAQPCHLSLAAPGHGRPASPADGCPHTVGGTLPHGHGEKEGVMTPDTSTAELREFIGELRAVDNHTHANTTVPGDTEFDALSLEVLGDFPLPVTLQPESPVWVAAYQALYGYPHDELLSDEHWLVLRATMRAIAEQHGERFPEWVLDRVGTEVMLTNRVAMGPGLSPPRFRWVSFVDALMFPLSTRAEAARTPDRLKLYPQEVSLLRRYLAELKVAELPGTLEAYLRTVVTPTLERHKLADCVAVKFEAALLRSLDFADVPAQTAAAVYSRYVGGGEPSHAEYKALQDFLFREISREAGRLGMAVHLHAFEGPGAYYETAGADPLLLEPTFNDPTLRHTRFVLVHGGGVFAAHARAMMWKPNVYVDTSAMALLYTPQALAAILRDWLRQFPDKVLFGTDAASFGPDTGWELAAWIGTSQTRTALAMALGDMVRGGEVSRIRAEEIATMVMRTNAGELYGLSLGTGSMLREPWAQEPSHHQPP
ncbi:amidohydrolase [Corallococcus praedator]|uniref:Amidohydrolase n=2 Tax=Myxococcaceae TaxID=31 RepID=A0ABX9QNB7_9BACT|nr:amidohydrolase [Corallococcus sp. CA031C]RKI14541.1 amidohydrolase [Corallococcus praedator]